MTPFAAYLPYAQIPEFLSPDEAVWVLQLNISGIQSFLFSHQSLYSTQGDLSRKSRYIGHLTLQLEQLLRDAFAQNHCRTLLRSSGKLLCALSAPVDRLQITDFLEQLRKELFCVTKGALQLNFAMLPALPCPESQMTPEMPSALPMLARQMLRNKYHATGLLDVSPQHPCRYLTPMEQLTSPQDSAAPSGEDCMAVKLDLDNLGTFFSGITALDTSLAASQALDQVICSCVENPIYIGGDDIFAVVPLSTAYRDIADIYRALRTGIFTRPELAPYRPHFSISGGAVRIPFAGGRVPAVYYFQKSEQMLKNAKNSPNKNCIFYQNKPCSWDQFLKIADLFEAHRDRLERSVGKACMPDYYDNLLAVAQKMKQLQLLG